MGFMPNMQSEIHGIVAVDGPNWRAWDGIVVDHWNVACSPGAYGDYISPNHRIFLTLSVQGGGFELETSRGSFVHAGPAAATFVPAGLHAVGRAISIDHLRHIDIHLSDLAVARLLRMAPPREFFTRPHFLENDEGLNSLACLLAEECSGQTTFHSAYGEGLLSAILVRLINLKDKCSFHADKRCEDDIQRIIEFVERNVFKPVRLSELTKIADASETQIARRFRQATGTSVISWHAERRLEHVKSWLRETDISLKDAAARAGYADQAHLTRAFKSHVGATPAAWRRKKKSE
ncbi:MAG: AraC family transcriptional regulator [Pseudomonadota bacterium]